MLQTQAYPSAPTPALWFQFSEPNMAHKVERFKYPVKYLVSVFVFVKQMALWRIAIAH